jgi:Na+-driven multidrug efflux pump
MIFALDWGMIGAALATVVSQAVSTFANLLHFLRGDGLLRIRKENLKPDFHMMKDILVVGMPIFLVQAAATVQLGCDEQQPFKIRR